jgi:protein-S-isoprenylcysteine O-methyltransferase Ste14
MFRVDFLLYYVHTAFWTAFGVTRLILRARERHQTRAPEPALSPTPERTAPFSRAVLALHALAFGIMYFGIGNAVIPGRVPVWFSGQRGVGSIVIAVGAALMVWALVYFQSWRFRAKLDVDHQLACGGPFRFLRHPIYMGMNLLALGSAVWVPTPLVWASFLLMAMGTVLRGRVEEALLTQAFGSRYREYCARTRRFIPGVY